MFSVVRYGDITSNSSDEIHFRKLVPHFDSLQNNAPTLNAMELRSASVYNYRLVTGQWEEQINAQPQNACH